MKDEAHIQRMLAKQYHFDIRVVLSRARELSSENNWVLVQALLTLVAVIFFLGFVFAYSFAIETPEDVQNLTNTQNAVASLIMNVVMAPLFAGIAMLAVTSARGIKARAINVFSYVSYILPLGVATLLISIAFDIGLMLLVLPGLYIFMATTFTLPLIVDKGLTPFSAIFLSIRMTNAYLYQMTMVFLIFFALFVGVLITFGFASIWVGPYFFNVKAVLYTELFCGKEDEQASSQGQTSEDGQSGVFNA
ncbi:stress protein [Ningiella sp. W23]|uniref:stress protein n=1 Tax=Ningiella sp. W23 TaxID=3023715 RepID=UPI0037583581